MSVFNRKPKTVTPLWRPDKILEHKRSYDHGSPLGYKVFCRRKGYDPEYPSLCRHTREDVGWVALDDLDRLSELVVKAEARCVDLIAAEAYANEVI